MCASITVLKWLSNPDARDDKSFTPVLIMIVLRPAEKIVLVSFEFRTKKIVAGFDFLIKKHIYQSYYLQARFSHLERPNTLRLESVDTLRNQLLRHSGDTNQLAPNGPRHLVKSQGRFAMFTFNADIAVVAERMLPGQQLQEHNHVT